MTVRVSYPHCISFMLACLFACVLACAIAPMDALAVTAAEKQAEADEVMAQIDSLQTSLNEANARYADAVEARDEAIAQRDEAAERIRQETARIERLQGELSQFAISVYKGGGNNRYIDVLLGTSSFEDFLTSWDAVSDVSKAGAGIVKEAKEAKRQQEEAKAVFEEQSERAEREMAAAEETSAQIEQTQAELREQVQKLTEEAAVLQAEEELQAERARQAEEARRIREEALAQAAGASTTAGDSLLIGSGYFTNPCPDAFNSSGFGYRSFDNSFHKGLDMAAASGTPYYAADSGTVIYATNDGGWNGGAGNWVVISHGNGIVTKYMHSSVTYVKPGDQVERGQNIGAVGETGQAFGAHLHFQVEVDGVAVNPLNYI